MSDHPSLATASSPFVYLLNAMEATAQAENPFERGYPEKRRAVLDYVAKLEASVRSENAGACEHDWSRPAGFETKKCNKCGAIEPVAAPSEIPAPPPVMEYDGAFKCLTCGASWCDGKVFEHKSAAPSAARDSQSIIDDGGPWKGPMKAAPRWRS